MQAAAPPGGGTGPLNGARVYAATHVVDLAEFERDYVDGVLTTRLRELPYFVLAPTVLSACKITANTFSPMVGKDGGSIFWCEVANGAGHALAAAAPVQDGLMFAPPQHERRQDTVVAWGAPWESRMDVVECLEDLLQLILGSSDHRLRQPVLISNLPGSPEQQLHQDL